MTFKEFLEKRPEDVRKAKACKTIDEFKKLEDNVGISYKGDAELKEAYNFIKNEQKELSKDALNNAAGGCVDHRDGYYEGPFERRKSMFNGSGKKISGVLNENMDWASNANKK